jgi:hypothetical protein
LLIWNGKDTNLLKHFIGKSHVTPVKYF